MKILWIILLISTITACNKQDNYYQKIEVVYETGTKDTVEYTCPVIYHIDNELRIYGYTLVKGVKQYKIIELRKPTTQQP